MDIILFYFILFFTFSKWIISSAIFLVIVPLSHHRGPVGSLGCMEEAKLTVIKWVFVGPPLSLLALLLTYELKKEEVNTL